jgi:hypothetical protein
MNPFPLILALLGCSAAFGLLILAADEIRRYGIDAELLLMVFIMSILIVAVVGGAL